MRSVCLGSYIPWDVKQQVEIIQRELGWQGDAVEGVPPEYDYEKIECFMQGVRDYLKFLKRGYGTHGAPDQPRHSQRPDAPGRSGAIDHHLRRQASGEP